MITCERYHDISCGHRVVGHEGKCRHLHGHNYRFHFTCAPAPERIDVTAMGDNVPRVVDCQPGTLDSVGRVVDFSVIKQQLCQWLEDNWDHRLLLWEQDPLAEELEVLDNSIVLVPFNPTAENIAKHMVEQVAPEQLHGYGVTLCRCKVEETRKCSATFTKETTA